MNESIKKTLYKIKNKNFDKIYFVSGSEDFYSNLIAKTLENNVFADKSAKAFDFTALYGKDTDMRKILQCTRTMPMISKYKLIIIKEAQNIADIKKTDGQKILLEYIKKPSPRTILCILFNKETGLDKRTSFGKCIVQNTNFIAVNKLYDNQVPQWIKNYTKFLNLNISEKAIHMIYEHVGNNLKRIANEIDKLMINLDHKDLIDDKVIQKYMGISREYNGFELQSAIIQKNINKICSILGYFQENPKACPIIPMTSIIYSLFTKIIKYHELQDKSIKNVASKLKINPWFYNQYVMAAKNYPIQKAIKALSLLHKADMKSKNINMPPTAEYQIAQELVCYIIM